MRLIALLVALLVASALLASAASSLLKSQGPTEESPETSASKRSTPATDNAVSMITVNSEAHRHRPVLHLPDPIPTPETKLSFVEREARFFAHSGAMAAADSLVSQLTASTDLNTETSEKLRDALRQERESALAIMQDIPHDSATREQALETLRAQTHDEVIELLTEQELAAYRALRPR